MNQILCFNFYFCLFFLDLNLTKYFCLNSQTHTYTQLDWKHLNFRESLISKSKQGKWMLFLNNI